MCKNHTFLEMPDVKVVNNMAENIFHMASNGDMSVRYKRSNVKAISSQKLHTLFKSKEFHCWAACLVPLEINFQTEIYVRLRCLQQTSIIYDDFCSKITMFSGYINNLYFIV